MFRTVIVMQANRTKPLEAEGEENTSTDSCKSKIGSSGRKELRCFRESVV
jgi:hypothetical protein